MFSVLIVVHKLSLLLGDMALALALLETIQILRALFGVPPNGASG